MGLANLPMLVTVAPDRHPLSRKTKLRIYE